MRIGVDIVIPHCKSSYKDRNLSPLQRGEGGRAGTKSRTAEGEQFTANRHNVPIYPWATSLCYAWVAVGQASGI